MLRGLRRPEHDELLAFLFDQRRKFLAIVRRHMPRAAVRTVVVAHAGPLIGPYPPAAGASVEVEKPGHASLLGSQTIISPRDEINKSAIAQILKLLAYLGFDVLIAGIKFAQVPFEGVNLVQREVAFPKRLHALHDVEQPATRLRRFVPEEKRLLPFRKDEFLGANETVLHDMNLAGLGDAAEQDIRPDPARAPCGKGQRLSFFDNLAGEKVFRHDEQVNEGERFEVVIHEEE